MFAGYNNSKQEVIANPPSSESNCPTNITLQDVLVMIKVIERSFEKGAITAKEAQIVGRLYERLEDFYLKTMEANNMNASSPDQEAGVSSSSGQ